MIEEKVIQSDSVNPAEQPVAETASQPTQPQAPNLDSVKTQYEEQIAALKKQIAEGEETAPDSSESEGEDAKPTEEETKEDNSEES